MNRKNLFALAALLLSVLLVFTACGKDAPAGTDYEQQIAALTQENAALKEQIEVLTQQLESIQNAVLTDWDLTATASPKQDSALISFTAIPAAAPEGQTVSLVVMLNGFEAESVQCTPAGNGGYYGELQLPAADGYSYYCLIANPDGAQQQIPLITEDNTEDRTLIDVASSLLGYCHLMVEDWAYSDNTLTVNAGYFQAMPPKLTSDGSAVVALKAELVLLHNGEEVSRQELPLTAGEAEGTFEGAISGLSFATPKLEDDHQLDLVLEISITGGEPLRNNSCSWYYIDGGLTMVVG